MKLIIKNKFRFIISTTIFFTIALFTVLAIVNTTFSHEEPNFKSVAVVSGDTLWSIAYDESQYNKYYINKDIRYIVNDIKTYNNLQQSYLKAGQLLIIPTY